jgi:hypothetical protein
VYDCDVGDKKVQKKEMIGGCKERDCWTASNVRLEKLGEERENNNVAWVFFLVTFGVGDEDQERKTESSNDKNK